MVGVPTSNRCDVCRKRKKKCSEQRPSCAECIKGGWKCPGYQTRWKFVDEVPRLEGHYADKKYVYDVINSKYIETGISSEVQYEQLLVLNESHVPRSLSAHPLCSTIVYCLGSNTKGALIPLRLVGSFFDFIPARLGHNAALDDAVTCLSSIYSNALPGLHEARRTGIYTGYVAALSSLRSCLDNPALRMESETLCASILLQLCELVINTAKGEWGGLLRGTIYLLQSRGVRAYNNEFDHAMLESQLAYVVRISVLEATSRPLLTPIPVQFAQSMRFGEDFFLCSSKWQALLFHHDKWPFHATQPRSLVRKNRLMRILVHLPPFIASVIDENLQSQPGCEGHVDALIAALFKISADVKNWLAVGAELQNMPAYTDEGTRGPPLYPDIIAGVLDCVSHKALLQIDEALQYLSRIRSRLNGGAKAAEIYESDAARLLDNSETIEGWRQRMIDAFFFVKAESESAAKPLEFGLTCMKFNLGPP